MIGITERGDAALEHDWKPWVTDGKPAILITKDPLRLSKEVSKEMNVIIHCTITGLSETVIEPNVPDINESISGYTTLLNMFGPERVVLRIDPIIPNKYLDSYWQEVIDGVDMHTKWIEIWRIRISFMDAYPHVRNRFRSINQLRLITWEGTHQTLALRREAYTRFSDYTRTKLPNASIEVCGEPGFECTGCISLKDCKILGYTPSREDKCQQRNACACLALKYELLKNRSQCTHACAYCYWH